MKIIGRILSIVVGITLIAGCENFSTIEEQKITYKAPSINEKLPQNNEDKNQLVEYINQHLNTYSIARDQAVLPYIEASERNNSKELKEVFQEKVLPFYEESLKELKQLKPKTAEILQLHQLLIQKEILYLETFQLNTIIAESYNEKTKQDLTNKMEQLQLVRSKFDELLTALNSKYSLKETY